jgi:hypothetical protein
MLDPTIDTGVASYIDHSTHTEFMFYCSLKGTVPILDVVISDSSCYRHIIVYSVFPGSFDQNVRWQINLVPLNDHNNFYIIEVVLNFTRVH